MTLSDEISTSLIMTPEEIQDYGKRAYLSGLYVGAYTPARTFWKGVAWGLAAAIIVMVTVWKMGLLP